MGMSRSSPVDASLLGLTPDRRCAEWAGPVEQARKCGNRTKVLIIEREAIRAILLTPERGNASCSGLGLRGGAIGSGSRLVEDWNLRKRSKRDCGENSRRSRYRAVRDGSAGLATPAHIPSGLRSGFVNGNGTTSFLRADRPSRGEHFGSLQLVARYGHVACPSAPDSSFAGTDRSTISYPRPAPRAAGIGGSGGLRFSLTDC